MSKDAVYSFQFTLVQFSQISALEYYLHNVIFVSHTHTVVFLNFF